jgi:NAD(P)-dependent dehydrogenase (short-subunit alcohol dehydrogenase family)
MHFLVRSIVLTVFVLIFTAFEQPAMAGDQKAVLVTGASTGIGREIAETLARDGYFVYAGARKQKDLDALNAIENIQAVRLDVTIQSEIDAAVETVRKGGKGLHGLINNAGIFVGGPLIEISMDDFHWLMDVNVYGVVRVTKAFAPMIIESKGRISTVGSISGILSGRFSGPYSMSKHAMEAFTDSLATEMAKFDVHVSVIEPGNYDSDIAKTALAKMGVEGNSYEDSYYKEEMTAWASQSWDRSKYKGPAEVAEAAADAMFGENPVRRYMVVPNEEEAGRTINKAIEELVQLNEWQEYSYTREQLIEKLDAAMAPPAEEAAE